MRKCIEVQEELWSYLKERAKRNGRTLPGELRSILENLRKRDKGAAE